MSNDDTASEWPSRQGQPNRVRSRLRRAAMMASGLLSVGLAVAACSGGPATPGVASGSTTTTAPSSAGGTTQGTGLLAYASCMRSHGVPNFPDPDSSGGANKSAVISALKAVSTAVNLRASNDCEHLLPAGGSLSGQPTETITVQDQQYYLNAIACMRSHGFSIPDPTFSGGTVHLSVPSSINQNSPQFTQAAQVCKRLIPAGLPKG